MKGIDNLLVCRNKMNQNTYLFYDIETTGLNKCFDQVLQFAAIRTDLSLNEISRHEINIRLNRDVIPSPRAILTHRMSIKEIQTGEPEITAIHKIHRLMNTPGTISLGYNSLGFDDEFLRFSFFRNLFPPYTHQYANQCKRMDLYPITAMYYLFKPIALNWPEIDGKVSLRLENLIQANQLAEGRAHNAIVDVEATLALAKKFIQYQKIWEYVIGYFDKYTDIQRCQQLQSRDALMIQGSFGFDLQYQVPVFSLGQHQYYKNQMLWLRMDYESLQQTTADTIPNTTSVIRKRAGEQPILLPTHNRFLIHLSSERKKIAHDNKAWLQAHPNLLQLICAYHQTYQYPKVENLDVDAALYETDFPTQHEEFLFQRFHLAAPNTKENIARQFPSQIRQEQAIRILGRHYPEALSEESKSLFMQYLNSIAADSEINIPTDYRNQIHLTPQRALQEIYILIKEDELDDKQLQLLQELEDYLKKL